MKADSVPTGILDSSGNLKGAEIDLAATLAKKLNVKFEPIIVTSNNRIEFLQHKKVDLLIATRRCAPDSSERPAGAVAGAQVDLNPHQVDAVLFAFASIHGTKRICRALPTVFNASVPPASSSRNGLPPLFDRQQKRSE